MREAKIKLERGLIIGLVIESNFDFFLIYDIIRLY